MSCRHRPATVVSSLRCDITDASRRASDRKDAVRYLVGTGDVVVSALFLHPGRLPDASVAVLVQVAAQHGQQRDQVEHREHADANHELHQLLLVLLLQWDLHADPVQRRDTRQQQCHTHLGMHARVKRHTD